MIFLRVLQAYGVNHTRHVWTPLEQDRFKPTRKGPCVYVYGHSPTVYFSNLVQEQVQRAFPKMCFIYASGSHSGVKITPPFKHYSREQLIAEIYPRCFLGLRLTMHDGGANGVQELGMMGIKSVWNGGSLASISLSLSVSLSIYQRSIDLYLPSFISISLSTFLSIYLYLSLSISLSIYLSLSLSLSLSLCRSIYIKSVWNRGSLSLS